MGEGGYQEGEVGRRAPRGRGWEEGTTGERLGGGHQGGEVGRRRVPGGRDWEKEDTRGERLVEGHRGGGERV